MKNFCATTALVAAIAVAGTNAANSAIIAQIGPQSFASTTATENFEGFTAFGYPGNSFSSGGFTFSNSGWELIIYGNGVQLPTKSLYQNGGSHALLQIGLDSGTNFQQLQFDLGNGFGKTTENLWLRTLNDGISTGYDFDLSVPVGQTVSLWTDGLTDFDSVLVGAFLSPEIRDTHDIATSYSAVAIDNVIAGTRAAIPVPEPLTISIFGVGLAGVLASRRRKHSDLPLTVVSTGGIKQLNSGPVNL